MKYMYRQFSVFGVGCVVNIERIAINRIKFDSTAHKKKANDNAYKQV